MSFTTIPLHPLFGARVTGRDLSEPLGAAEAAGVLDLLAEHGVLLFPGQELTPAEEVAFAAAINEVRRPHGNEYVVEGFPDVAILSNVIADGRQIGFQNKFGIEWHADGSGWQRDTLATCLYCVETPREGGDTLFASGYAGYEALPDDLRRRAEEAILIYDRAFLIEKLRVASGDERKLSDEERASYPPVRRPLVVRHPRNGRPAINMTIEECREVVGMDGAESRAFLEEIERHVTAEALVYTHRWTPADLMVWDNRCMLHSTTPYTYADERRLMHRVIGLVPEHAAV